MKEIKLLITTAMMSMTILISAFAGEWKQDITGWKYQNDNGTNAINGWQWIDANHDNIAECYYFDASGYCLMNTQTPDGMTVDSNGAWIVDGVVQQKLLTDGTSAKAATETVSVTAPATNSSSNQNTNQKAVENTVYWTPSGEKYHSTPNCSTLKRSKKILSGTKGEAGSRDSCKVCH